MNLISIYVEYNDDKKIIEEFLINLNIYQNFEVISCEGKQNILKIIK